MPNLGFEEIDTTDEAITEASMEESATDTRLEKSTNVAAEEGEGVAQGAEDTIQGGEEVAATTLAEPNLEATNAPIVEVVAEKTTVA